MKSRQALAAFAALSQETRLGVIRLLVREGPDGIAAGVIAQKAKCSPSNTTFHLKELEKSGLIEARREAQSIIYSADFDALRNLIGFLMNDCCGGRPEICAPVLAAPSCSPAKSRKRAHA